MANYRRHFVPGGSFFFTVNLADRSSSLLIDRIDLLRAAIREVCRRFPFTLEAIVVLANDQIDLLAGYRTRGAPVEEPAGKKRTGVWQRRYWEHTLRDERDFNRHCDYIHFNPVKHGYVNSAKEWAFSSFHRFVERGVYPIDWGGGDSDDESDFGER